MEMNEWIYVLVKRDNDGDISELKLCHIETDNPIADLETIEAECAPEWQIHGVSKGGRDALRFMQIANEIQGTDRTIHVFGKIGYTKGSGSPHNSYSDYVRYVLVNFPEKQMVSRQCAEGLYLCWNDDDRGYEWTRPLISVKSGT